MDRTTMELSPADRKSLYYAVDLLESGNFLVRVTSVLGTPIEKMLQKLPDPAAEAINNATDKALRAALWAAAKTTRDSRQQASWDVSHKAGATATGGLGGFFGLLGAAIELPITTTVMLRSFLDIARSEGADITSPSVRVECINVFAFGGSTQDPAETSYFTVRSGLAALTQRAAAYLATAKGKQKTGEIAAKLNAYLAKVAGRYAPVVSEKFAGQSVPVVGAIAGALINLAFTDYFQDKARGHFIVLRLEEVYGKDLIKAEYEKAAAAKRNARKRRR